MMFFFVCSGLHLCNLCHQSWMNNTPMETINKQWGVKNKMQLKVLKYRISHKWLVRFTFTTDVLELLSMVFFYNSLQVLFLLVRAQRNKKKTISYTFLYICCTSCQIGQDKRMSHTDNLWSLSFNDRYNRYLTDNLGL